MPQDCRRSAIRRSYDFTANKFRGMLPRRSLFRTLMALAGVLFGNRFLPSCLLVFVALQTMWECCSHIASAKSSTKRPITGRSITNCCELLHGANVFARSRWIPCRLNVDSEFIRYPFVFALMPRQISDHSYKVVKPVVENHYRPREVTHFFFAVTWGVALV